MDQTQFEDYNIFWYIGKRGKNANMDRNVSLCSGCDYKETVKRIHFTLHFITDFEREYIPKGFYFTIS